MEDFDVQIGPVFQRKTGPEWTMKTCPFSKVENGRCPALDFQGFHVIFKGPGLGFSRISRHFQRPRPWIFKDFTSFSRAPALDFQGFHVIFKGPGLGISRISCHFQGPRPWIFKDFPSFSRAPALDFQGFHVIFKGPGLGFSTLTSKLPLFFEEGRPHRPGRDGFPSQMFASSISGTAQDTEPKGLCAQVLRLSPNIAQNGLDKAVAPYLAQVKQIVGPRPP